MPDLWPFVPRIDVKDVLSFKTDIRRTRVGEVRDGMRDARRIISMEFFLDDSKNALAESIFRANVAGDLLVPLWPEMTKYTVAKPIGETVFAVDNPSDYLLGGYAAIAFASESIEAVQITDIGQHSITVASPSTFAVDAVIPVGAAYFVGGLGGSRIFTGMSARTAEFAFRNDLHIGETPFDQYLGADLVTDPSVIAAPVESNISMARVFVDNESGPVVIEPMRDIIDGTSKIVYIDHGMAAMIRRRMWLRYMRGRDKSFWIPTWGNDLTMTAPANNTQSYIDVSPLQGSHLAMVGRHIVIYDGAGFMPRKITASFVVGQSWRLGIDPLDRQVEADVGVMFLSRMRLDADKVEMATTGIYYMETTLPVVEVPE